MKFNYRLPAVHVAELAPNGATKHHSTENHRSYQRLLPLIQQPVAVQRRRQNA